MHAFQPVVIQPVHEKATYICDDIRGWEMQFWPPDDDPICSKRVEEPHTLIVKKLFTSNLLISEMQPGQQNV